MAKLRALCVMGLLGVAAVQGAYAQGFDHATFDTVLARFVQDGRVDYAALKADRAVLDRYLERVAAVDAEEFAAWPESERIAYLINAYNAYVLETVIDHYPIKGSGFFKKLTSPKRFAFPSNSIRHIGGVFDGIEHRAAGRRMTLDDIEHRTLRAEYGEPRIHFALVCAALSCPPLRWEAYRGERLDRQLDEQARAFLNDPRQNRYEDEGGRVYLSKIFDWFGEDFAGFAVAGGARGDAKLSGVLGFVSRYVRGPAAEFLRTGVYDVRFLDYDWTLNDQAVAAAGR
jgi:hypothetical protein